MTTATVQRKTLTRAMPDGSLVVALLEIRGEGGDLSAGFALTGEVYDRRGTWSGEARRRNGREPDVCGQVVDELARAFPRLEPFARMHLSDLDGVPMHADANARYFLSTTDGYDLACRTLRVSEIPAEAIAALRPDYREPGEAWTEWFDGLRATWAQEAQEAREVFDAIEESA